MSKRYKSQASSSRAAASAAGAFGGAFGGQQATFSGLVNGGSASARAASSLSYFTEPPNLSAIHDSNVVVTFKNLLKKDSTTKAKALDELQAYLVRKAGDGAALEDGLLEAWFNVYPRLSIDLSRRVRQTAQAVQGQMVSSAGKRVARLIPTVIGAWLAGLYDSEKPVIRAAQGSLVKVFTTNAKRQGVWKAYQEAILSFVEDAILTQTPMTLSDERSTRSDDMDAKHARVVGTAVYTCNRLLAGMGPSEIKKSEGRLRAIIASKKTWSFAHHADPFVRRAVYALLQTVLSKDAGLIDWQTLSSAMLSKALAHNQLGSSMDYIKALTILTQTHPTVWTDEYSGKTPATNRLHQFLRAGSQGGFGTYWKSVSELLRALPAGVIVSPTGQYDLSAVSALLESVYAGLPSRNDSSPLLATAWKCYFSIAVDAGRCLASQDDRCALADQHLLSLLEQYLFGSEGGQVSKIPAASVIDLMSEDVICAARLAGETHVAAFWRRMTNELASAMQLSEPLGTRHWRSSQEAVCSRASRFFAVLVSVAHTVTKDETTPELTALIGEVTSTLMDSATALLVSRQGHPYGAAAVLQHLATFAPIKTSGLATLDAFIVKDLPMLILSPSGERMMRLLFSCRAQPAYKSALASVIEQLDQADVAFLPSATLQTLYISLSAEDVSQNTRLPHLVETHVTLLLKGRRRDWPTFAAVFANAALKDIAEISVTPMLLSTLAPVDDGGETLESIAQLLEQSGVLGSLASGPHGSELALRLLRISEGADDEDHPLITRALEQLRSVWQGSNGTKLAVDIVHRGLPAANEDSLSVDMMLDVATKALSASGTHAKILSLLLPTAAEWETALEPCWRVPPRPSEALINSLGGLVSRATMANSSKTLGEVAQVSHDPWGCSSLVRLAQFTTRLLTRERIDLLDQDRRDNLFKYLPLATRIINADLSVSGSKGLLSVEDYETRTEASELVASSTRLMHAYAATSNGALYKHWDKQQTLLLGSDIRTYYLAETSVKVLSEGMCLGAEVVERALQSIKRVKSARDPFISAAVVAAYQDAIITSTSSTRLCNELVADLTSPNLSTEEALPMLVQLRILGSEPLQKVQHQKVAILANRLTSRLQASLREPAVAAELALALTAVIPVIDDMYGDHWSAMFQAVGAMWAHAQSADDFLPYIDASLRLFGKLHAMATADGSNDDLADAWVQATWQCSHSVIRLLTDIGPSLGQGQGQPGSIVAGLLARTALMVQVAEVKDVTPLLSALASSNKSVQTAALDILRQALPQTMEDLCLGVALGEKEVGLPDKLADLLSQTPPLVILIGAPTANDVFWPPIRAYFLAWSYLFESLALASIPVRDKYAQIIKQHGFLEGLLDYIYEMLQTPTGKLVDASKFDIRHFEVNQSASEERELQWFAIHLYYLCLRYLPSLTTAWWSDSKNRVKGPVEAWTENHFSPLIIEDALHGVQEWYTDQDWSEDDLVMEVKISLNVKEIVASIAVDEDSPPSSIAITMPAGYPLHLPAVEGRTRIAVNDKTWQSWLRTIAGAIKFQGSLIDALIIYRRNTQGALKGQTECAICYSIVSPSMKLPNKRCATCKNTFHSDCLFRWFTSSNASSCPLCRNNFIYS